MSETEALSELIRLNRNLMVNWELPEGSAAECSALTALLTSSKWLPSMMPAEQEGLVRMFELIAHLDSLRSNSKLEIDPSFESALFSQSPEIQYSSLLICYHSCKRNLGQVPEWLKTIASQGADRSRGNWDKAYFLFAVLSISGDPSNSVVQTAALHVLSETMSNPMHPALESALRYLYRRMKLYPEQFNTSDNAQLTDLLKTNSVRNPSHQKKLLKLCSKCSELDQEAFDMVYYIVDAGQLKFTKDEYLLNLCGRTKETAFSYASSLFYKHAYRESLDFVLPYLKKRNPESIADVFNDYCLSLIDRKLITTYRGPIMEIVKLKVYGAYRNETFLKQFFYFACAELSNFTYADEIVTLLIIYIHREFPIHVDELSMVDLYVTNLIQSVRHDEDVLLANISNIDAVLQHVCKLLPECTGRLRNIIERYFPDPRSSNIKDHFLKLTTSQILSSPISKKLTEVIQSYAALCIERTDFGTRENDFLAFADSYRSTFDYESVSVADSRNLEVVIQEFVGLIRNQAIPEMKRMAISVDESRCYHDTLEQLKTSIVAKLLSGEAAFQVKQWIVSHLSKLFKYKVLTNHMANYLQQLYQGALVLACSTFTPLQDHEIEFLGNFVFSPCFREALEKLFEAKVGTPTIRVPDNATLLEYVRETYFADLPANTPAVTVFGGTILLNSNQKNNDDLSQCKQIVSILHELAHKIRKMEHGNYQILKFTPEKAGKFFSGMPGHSLRSGTEGSKEGGKILENLLFGCFVTQVNDLQLRYLLIPSNWTQSLTEFNSGIEKLGLQPSSATYTINRSQPDIYDLMRREPSDSLHSS